MAAKNQRSKKRKFKERKRKLNKTRQDQQRSTARGVLKELEDEYGKTTAHLVIKLHQRGKHLENSDLGRELREFMGPHATSDYLAVMVAELERGRGSIFIRDMDRVPQLYHDFKSAMQLGGNLDIHAAAKSMPDEVIRRLAAQGCDFEVASPLEAKQCIKMGADGSKIISTNLNLRPIDYLHMIDVGMRTFAVHDRVSLAHVLAAQRHAGKPLEIIVRILGGSAESGFGGRFGANLDDAYDLMREIDGHRHITLEGISFHAGSHLPRAIAWQPFIEAAATLMNKFEASHSYRPNTLDIGGGFPAQGVKTDQGEMPQSLAELNEGITGALRAAFGNKMPKRMVVEPGRALCATSAIGLGIVTGVKKEGEGEDTRFYVTTTLGQYNFGLFDLSGFYATFYNGSGLFLDGDAEPAEFFGQACASLDRPLPHDEMPKGLHPGAIVLVKGVGAYTDQRREGWNRLQEPRMDIIRGRELVQDDRTPLRVEEDAPIPEVWGSVTPSMN